MKQMHTRGSRLLMSIVLTAALCLISSSASAAPQFGLGISITETGRVIHCPVKLNNAFRLEGSLGFYSMDREGSSNDPNEFILKFGAYGIQNVYEKTEIYYGGKILYSQLDTGTSDADGFGIAPAFGFEYYLTGHISVGGEAELYYLFYDRNTGDYKEFGTDSRIVLRYYF